MVLAWAKAEPGVLLVESLTISVDAHGLMPMALECGMSEALQINAVARSAELKLTSRRPHKRRCPPPQWHSLYHE